MGKIRYITNLPRVGEAIHAHKQVFSALRGPLKHAKLSFRLVVVITVITCICRRQALNCQARKGLYGAGVGDFMHDNKMVRNEIGDIWRHLSGCPHQFHRRHMSLYIASQYDAIQRLERRLL